MVDDDLVNRGDGLFLQLSNNKLFDFGELPVVREAQDGGPIFRGGIVDRVFPVRDIAGVSDMESG